MDSRTKAGVAAAMATEVIYGCSFAFTKQATGMADPITLLGWRFVIALIAMVVLAAAGVIRLHITRTSLRALAVLAVFMPIGYYLAETFGVMRTTASESGLVLSVIPVVNLVAAVLVLKARPSRMQVIGIVVTLVGVVATTLAAGIATSGTATGYVLLLAAVFTYAAYAVTAEKLEHVSDVDKTFAMVVVGAVFFGTWALARHASSGTLTSVLALPVHEPSFAIAVGYLALVSTVAAFFCQNKAIRLLGTTTYSSFVGVSTVTALVTGSLALGERLHPVQLVGGAVILLGVYLANRPTPFEDPTPAL